ncbi:MAG: hypothetical protein DRN92_07525 [Thermoproteota archaeon]|nr:MAG: hypothetical protein DRN92_07525 [Candidatus Korarchaeota archaeon]
MRPPRRRMEVRNQAYNDAQRSLNYLKNEIKVLEFSMSLLAPIPLRDMPFRPRSSFIKREYF